MADWRAAAHHVRRLEPNGLEIEERFFLSPGPCLHTAATKSLNSPVPGSPGPERSDFERTIRIDSKARDRVFLRS
jgi:hypothetical protein